MGLGIRLTRRDTTAGPSIEELERRRDDLLVFDIDEVVLHFVEPFRALLEEHGAHLHPESFRLTGNVRSISTGAAMSGHELSAITQTLYDEQEQRQGEVAGAAAALGRLSEHADVLFLTAMTPVHYDRRRRLLDRLGLVFPMIATERSKGAVMAELSRRWPGRIVFVDDLPPNLDSVRRSAPAVHLLHLMASDVFRPHLPPMPRDTLEARDWAEAEPLLLQLLKRIP